MTNSQKKQNRSGRASAAKRVAKKASSTGGGFKRWARGHLRRAASIALIVLLLPYFLVLVYKLPFIKPVSTLMVYQSMSGVDVQRIWVPLDEISHAMQFSAVASEDAAYCFHNGVEFGELRIQIGRALSGKSSRGASTIAMQTVKNLYLWHGRSYFRKVYEVPLAMWADFVWGKKRTLEIYLNVAEFGPGVFGVEQVGLKRFRTSAANLSWKNSALIATTLPLPAKRNPAKPSRKHQILAQKVRKRAGSSGPYIACLKQ